MGAITRPRSIRWACRLMVGVALAGLVHVVVGLLELRRLDANLATVTALNDRPQFYGVLVAAKDLRSTAMGALIVGAVALALAPVTWALLRWAVRWARGAVLSLHFALAGAAFLLMGTDSGIGIKPYHDVSGVAANEELANSLLVVPSYLPVHYAAEVALLVLAVAVIVIASRESTVEFLRTRWGDGTGKLWDMSPSLAKLRGEQTAR